MSTDASGETPGDQGGADDAARPLGSIRGEGQRATRLTEALKRYIVVNRLPPGTRLPPERQLATALMAGRNAVREALHSLAILGIVEKRQGSGIYVRDFDGERLAEQLSYGLREDAEYWYHVLEARIEVETMLIPLVARRITDAQLARLRALLASMRQQVEQRQSIERTDIEFHLALAACAANPVLERLAQMVIGEDFRYVSSMRLDRALLGDRATIRNHEPLLEALAARDPAASVDAMRYHFRQLRGFIDELVATASAKPAGREA